MSVISKFNPVKGKDVCGIRGPSPSRDRGNPSGFTYLNRYRLERELTKAGKYHLAGMPVIPPTYECAICKTTAFKSEFETLALLVGHYAQWHQDSDQMTSCLCGVRGGLALMQRHTCTLKDTRCGVCNVLFAAPEALVAHIATEHKDMDCSWTLAKVAMPTRPVEVREYQHDNLVCNVIEGCYDCFAARPPL